MLEIMFGGAGAILLTLLCIRFWRAALAIVVVGTVGFAVVFAMAIQSNDRAHEEARMKVPRDANGREVLPTRPCSAPDKDGWVILCH